MRWLTRRIQSWWFAKVRAIGRGDCYVRLTPNLGLSLPWFGRRLRWAPHHGLQLVVWRGNRWVVSRQVLGTSRVQGEVRERGGN